MRLRICSAFCLALLLAPAGPAQTASPAFAVTPSADKYRDEGAVIEHYDVAYRMHADGTGERTHHVVVRLQSEGAAQNYSVLSLYYNAENSTGTIENVHVRSPDGTIIATPASDSMEVAAEVTREAPMYSDLKQRQLPVRSVAVGDTLEYDLHVVYTKAEAPQQFWGVEHFITNAVVLSETLTLEVPSDKYVKVYSPNHPSTTTEHAGTKTYHWAAQQLKGTGEKKADGKPDPIKDPDEDDDGRDLPSVAWTTFHSWADVGDWYRSLASERAQPTDELRARAAALTKDAKTPEDKVRAIYHFVSENTRYVGIDLGAGRYQPHFAAVTLSNHYGDCKDKDTLLEALLRSDGFQTAPALIGVGITPVPDLPSPATFNHVITTVEIPGAEGKPATRVWLDSTPGAAPYRMLIPQIRDEDALVVPPVGVASLQHTPKEPVYPYSSKFIADASLDKDGLLTGHMVMEDRSDAELMLRALQHNVAPAQWDKTMQYLSGMMGFGGTVSNASMRPTEPNMPSRLTWDYKRPEFGNWASLQILPLFPALNVTTIDKETPPEHDINQGAPRTLVAITKIKLPEGYLAELPNAVHVTRTYATYDQTYKLAGQELTMERKVVVLKEKVPNADWKDYLAYTKAIGMDSGENYIQLVASQPKQLTNQADIDPKLGSKVLKNNQDAIITPEAIAGVNHEISALMRKADGQYRSRDVEGEKDTLLKIKEIDPNTPYLWSMMGYVAEQQHKPDEGIEDVEKELANHPDDNSNIPVLLGYMYMRQKRYDDSVAVLKQYEDRKDASISLALARAQTLAGDKDAAVSTMRRASDSHPDDRSVLTQYARSLHDAHRDTEAVAAAKAAIDGSDDANSLNSNSYLLSEMKMELPLAEASSRRSVDLLEDATAKVTVQEANNAAFFATSNLLAAYDTLAYILLLEKKPAEAEPYQRAAWLNRPDVVVGNHLAQIEEALGRPDEALTIGELALATDNAANSTVDYAEAKRNVERLRKAGAHSKAGDTAQTLQQMRTYKVKRATGVKGWGTFRVQIGPGGIADSELASGSPGIRPMTSELNKVQIKQLLPQGSKARILRDGVLSCSSTGETCEFVFMTNSGLAAEGVQ